MNVPGIKFALLEGPAALGTFDLTVAGMAQPKAFWMFSSRHTQNQTLGAFRAGVSAGCGATDGTNEVTIGLRNRNNVATQLSDSTNSATATYAALRAGNGLLENAYEFDSFLSNGVRLDCVSLSSNNGNIVGMFVVGDANVYVGRIATPPVNLGETWSLTGLAWEPDWVLGWSEFGLNTGATIPITSNGSNSGSICSYGFAKNTGGGVEQSCITFGHVDNQNPANCRVATNDNYWLRALDATGNRDAIELTSFNSDGFTVTRRESRSVTASAMFMAVEGISADAVFGTDPTTATDKDFSFDVYAESILAFFSRVTGATNTVFDDDQAGAFGVGFYEENGDQACVNLISENVSSGNSLERVLAHDRFMFLPEHDATQTEVDAGNRVTATAGGTDVTFTDGNVNVDFDVVSSGGARHLLLTFERAQVQAIPPAVEWSVGAPTIQIGEVRPQGEAVEWSAGAPAVSAPEVRGVGVAISWDEGVPAIARPSLDLTGVIVRWSTGAPGITFAPLIEAQSVPIEWAVGQPTIAAPELRSDPPAVQWSVGAPRVELAPLISVDPVAIEWSVGEVRITEGLDRLTAVGEAVDWQVGVPTIEVEVVTTEGAQFAVATTAVQDAVATTAEVFAVATRGVQDGAATDGVQFAAATTAVLEGVAGGA